VTDEELGPVADRRLVEDGWQRRYLADPDRANEAAESYRELGFEVRIERLTPDHFGPQCQSCAQTICSSYVMIYTRRPAPEQA